MAQDSMNTGTPSQPTPIPDLARGIPPVSDPRNCFPAMVTDRSCFQNDQGMSQSSDRSRSISGAPLTPTISSTAILPMPMHFEEEPAPLTQGTLQGQSVDDLPGADSSVERGLCDRDVPESAGSRKEFDGNFLDFDTLPFIEVSESKDSTYSPSTEQNPYQSIGMRNDDVASHTSVPAHDSWVQHSSVQDGLTEGILSEHIFAYPGDVLTSSTSRGSNSGTSFSSTLASSIDPSFSSSQPRKRRRRRGPQTLTPQPSQPSLGCPDCNKSFQQQHLLK